MYVCTVYTPPIWKNGYAEYRSLKPTIVMIPHFMANLMCDTVFIADTTEL